MYLPRPLTADEVKFPSFQIITYLYWTTKSIVMKKMLSIFVLLLAACAMYGQDITGTWKGSNTFETPDGDVTLRIVFHISATENGYTSTMESPDQNAFDIPMDETTYTKPDLTIKLSQIDFVFNGKLSGEKEIKGSFTQSGQTFDLNLTREEE